MKPVKILIGTTNPAKVRYYEKMLAEYHVDFLTLADLKIAEEAEETGQDPAESCFLRSLFRCGDL